MKYCTYGSLKNIESELILEKMKLILPDIKGRPRLFGYDIQLENFEIEFYINSYDEIEYQFDISSKSSEYLLKITELVKQKLLETDALFDLYYSVLDEVTDKTIEEREFFSNFE